MRHDMIRGALFLSLACALPGCGGGEDTGPGGGPTGAGGGGGAGATGGGGSGAVHTPVPSAGCGAGDKPDGEPTLTLTSGGKERFAVVHFPPGYDPSVPAPLVLAYHYAKGTPSALATVTGLNDAADAAGAVIAYPVGVEGTFNAGKCCGKPWEDGTDDVTFTSDLLDLIEGTYCIDRARVSATGMSNGGMMAYRLGCELSGRVSAIAPVAGALHTGAPCVPSRPVAALAIHGTADASIPYEGGEGQPPIPVSGDLTFSSVADSVAALRASNGCGDATEEVYQKGDATCVAWQGCAAGGDVELCTIDGGGHTWPSGSFPSILGATSTDLDASATVLRFLAGPPAK